MRGSPENRESTGVPEKKASPGTCTQQPRDAKAGVNSDFGTQKNTRRERLTGRSPLSAATDSPIKVLLVEDNVGDADLIREMLDDKYRGEMELTHVSRITEVQRHIIVENFDIMLLDLGLPDAQGLQAVRKARVTAPYIPLVVLTGLDDEKLATLALEEGAQDYLIKGEISARGLRRAVRYAIERKMIEEKLFAEQEKARVTLNSIADAVISTNLDGNITYLNKVAETLTTWSQQEALGKQLDEILHIIDATTRKTVSNPEGSPSHQLEELSNNSILLRRDGTEIAIENSAAPILDRQGDIAGTVTVIHDVSLKRALELKMGHMAQHDSLTDLPNRRLLDDRLTQAVSLARRRRKQLAVLFIDVDRFKYINDSLGHAIGDKALKSVAERLKACVRESDTVARQGGDEFIVLLPEIANASDACIVAKKVLGALALPHRLGKHEIQMSASIGISTCPDDAVDAESLINNADAAMYQAKETGRNNYQFFKSDMNATVGVNL